MSEELAHKELSGILFERGEKFPKKHGNWIRFSFDGNSHFIMDSWNKKVTVVYGDCNYDNQFTGFTDYKVVANLGGNFGRFHREASEQIINAWIEKLI